MPKKKPGMTPEEQSQKFKDAAQSMIDAGELNPTEAERTVEELLRASAKQKK